MKMTDVWKKCDLCAVQEYTDNNPFVEMRGRGWGASDSRGLYCLRAGHLKCLATNPAGFPGLGNITILGGFATPEQWEKWIKSDQAREWGYSFLAEAKPAPPAVIIRRSDFSQSPQVETDIGIHAQLGIPVEYVPVAALRRLMPQVLPPHWQELKIDSGDGIAYTYEPPFGRRYKVLASASREEDGRLWLHVSLSKWRENGKEMVPPDWQEIRAVKELFVGRDREAYIVLPPAARYVDLKEVHHLWCCLAGPVLPDFSSGLGTI